MGAFDARLQRLETRVHIEAPRTHAEEIALAETILGAAEKGFATQSYRRVYKDYSAVSEKVMSQQRVPPGYRFYVKRYFQMIKPRE